MPFLLSLLLAASPLPAPDTVGVLHRVGQARQALAAPPRVVVGDGWRLVRSVGLRITRVQNRVEIRPPTS